MANSSEKAKKKSNIIDHENDRKASQKEHLEFSEENLEVIAQLIVGSQNSMQMGIKYMTLQQ